MPLDESAALVLGGLTAVHFLERNPLRPEMRMLVNGASGSVGTALVQLASHEGTKVRMSRASAVPRTPNSCDRWAPTG